MECKKKHWVTFNNLNHGFNIYLLIEEIPIEKNKYKFNFFLWIRWEEKDPS